MKWSKKPFIMVALTMVLTAAFFIYRKQEHNSVFGCPVVNQEKVDKLIAGKQRIETPGNLLLYQYQELPFRKEDNTFLVPGMGTFDKFGGNLSSRGGEKIYLKKADALETEGSEDAGSSSYAVYIMHDAVYYETFIRITPSTVLTFYTDTFESENAYGELTLYMPEDEEIGTYSVKSSEATLSYEVKDGLSTVENRNYTFELSKNGLQHKMSLAGLRKDDDWELDALPENAEQILLFFQKWNAFCASSGEERFMVSYQVVEFYMDEQYMGRCLLRVPLDEKQIERRGGYFLPEAPPEESVYSKEISQLLSETVTDVSLRLEYLFWQEKHDGKNIVYAMPRRFQKVEQPQ